MQELVDMPHPSSLPLKVAQAYKAVNKYIEQRSGLFKIVVLFLSPGKRPTARAMYAFFRNLDDMVDEGQMSLPAFRAWRKQAIKRLDQQTDPILITWSYVREKYGIDQQLVSNMLDGIEMDVERQRYDTFDDLLLYCYRVASSAAFLSLPLFEVKPGQLAEAKLLIEKLALALQITDILCDIDADLAKGRIYLPKNVLNDFGLTYHDIEEHVYDERFKRMMQQLSGIARGYFAEAWPVFKCFSAVGRVAAGFGSTVFVATLDRIEQNDFDVYSKPIQFSKAQKAWLLVTYLGEYFGLVKRSWS